MGERQSRLWKATADVDSIGNFPGADPVSDRVRAIISSGEVDVASLPEPIETMLSAALVSEGDDAVQVATKYPLDVSDSTVPVEQQTPVSVEDANGNSINPATEATLSSTLAREIATWTAGTLPVNQQTPVEIGTWSGGTLPVEHQGVIDVSSRDSRNLGDVDVTDLPDSDYAESEAQTLTANGSVDLVLTATGADALDGRVKSSGTYDVVVEWQTSGGNQIKSTTVASGVAGGTWTDISSETAVTPFAVVRINDTSGADQTADGGVHLR